MSTNDWKHEMHTMLDIFHRQATISLQKIIVSLESQGRSFNTEFRDIYLNMSRNTLTTAFVEVESEHKLRQLDRKQTFARNSVALNHRENVDQNQEPMDDDFDSNAVNVKMEPVFPSTSASTNSRAVNSATPAASIIIVDSSDDENDDTLDGSARLNIEANSSGIESINNERADEIVTDDPPHEANRQQASGSTFDASEDENMAVDQAVPLCSNNNVLDETDTADAATVADEEPNDLSDFSVNDANKNMPSTSSSVTKVPPQANDDVEAINQRPFVSVSMKKCRSCPFVTRFKSNLKEHMQSHTGQRKPYKCHICSEYFSNPEEVERHLKIKRHRFKFYCSGCSRGFPFAYQKIHHEKECKSARMYECYVCRTFTVHNLTGLEIHMRQHTGDTPYSCDKCRNRYECLKDLQRHLTEHAEPDQFGLDF